MCCPTPLDAFTQDVLGALSMQAGLAFERVRDRQALLEESLHDELTGLGNRRKAIVRLERLRVSVATRSSSTATDFEATSPQPSALTDPGESGTLIPE